MRKKKKETGKFLSPKKTVEPELYKSIDGFDLAVIQHKITEFYTVRKQLPPLRNLHQALTADIKFSGSLESL